MLRNLVLLLVLVLVVPISAQDDPLPNPTQIFTDVYNQASPSVVSIKVSGMESHPEVEGSIPNIPFSSGGSGFVIDIKGYIVTNFHVVDNADRIEVAFFDGTQVQAEVIGIDPDSDLAIIAVELPAEHLIPLEFADSDALEIGQTVLAIGSPFGQHWTLTSGIVSAVDRTIPGLTLYSVGSVIQTDAAINPGNSGGPLLDLAGRVVGVNSQIRTDTGGNSGVGFAIPSNLTKRVANLLIEDGEVEYSFLGIRGGDVTLTIIEELGLPNNFQGIMVSFVQPDGPAAQGGFQSLDFDEDGNFIGGDIITGVEGIDLRSMNDLITYLARNTSPGDTITFAVLRNGEEEIELEVRLTPRQR